MKKAKIILGILLFSLLLVPLANTVHAKTYEKKYTIHMGDTKTLSTKTYSSFKSSNKKIVTVSSKGKIKGIKPGTVEITAKKKKKTVYFKVTVKEKLDVDGAFTPISSIRGGVTTETIKRGFPTNQTLTVAVGRAAHNATLKDAKAYPVGAYMSGNNVILTYAQYCTHCKKWITSDKTVAEWNEFITNGKKYLSGGADEYPKPQKLPSKREMEVLEKCLDGVVKTPECAYIGLYTSSHKYFYASLGKGVEKAKGNAYRAKLNQIRSSVVKSGMSEKAKINALGDYVMKLLDYDLNIMEDGVYSELAAINKKKGKCAQYSDLFRDLCLSSGINAETVIVNKGTHAINCVKTGGQYYYFDLTNTDDLYSTNDSPYCWKTEPTMPFAFEGFTSVH